MTAALRHEDLRVRLTELGFTHVSATDVIEEWEFAALSVLVPLDSSKGDYEQLCDRVERQIAPLESVYGLGQAQAWQAATKLLSDERDIVAIKMRDGVIPVDQRFLDGVSHAWSKVLYAKS
jgi:hypothetical protein